MSSDPLDPESLEPVSSPPSELQRFAILAAVVFDAYLLSRDSDWLELPGPNPLLLTALILLAVNGAALDLNRPRSLIARAWRRAGECTDRTYWWAFATLLSAGALYRACLTYALGVPSATPDTPSYLIPALASTPLPFSEVRTAGTPLLASLGLELAGPLGILLVHNLLWLLSTALLCASLKLRLQQRFVSLALLVYLCGGFKNLQFEYALMSEHAARCGYVAFFGLVVLAWGRVTWARTAGLAAVAFAGVLAKPSALVLVPGAALFYASQRWAPLARSAPLSGRRAVAHTAVFSAIVLGLLGGYALVYQQRYGKFATNAFTGTALFAQVGHLTDLDAPKHPQLRAELAQILPRYAAVFAASGDHRPNWLAFGSVDDERLRAEFGVLSPPALIEAELRRSRDPSQTLQQQRDQLFKELALSGIRAHPGAYLRLACSDWIRLFRTGVGSFYGDVFQSCGVAAYGGERAVAFHRTTVERWFLPAYDQAGVPRPALSPRRSQGTLRGLSFLGTWIAFGVSALAQAVFTYAWLLLLLLGPVLYHARHASGDVLLLASLLLLTVAGYGLLLALICISETPRFTTNVQDCLLLAMLLLGKVELDVLTARPDFGE